jgi:hypothetical protein
LLVYAVVHADHSLGEAIDRGALPARGEDDLREDDLRVAAETARPGCSRESKRR